MKIEYKLVNTSTGTPNVSVNHNIYEFFYPCETNYDCTDYEVILPKGRYYFEAYGASGGIHSNVYTSSYVDKNRKCSNDTSAQAHANVVCDPSKYSSGPGGYVRAALNLSRETVAYIMIGGQGAYGKGSPVPGGYGGGGDGHNSAAAGGGRTALMMQKDDIFHSVLVAGAGGGSDDAANNNDGIAGSGGGLIGQSFWFSSTYIQGYEANIVAISSRMETANLSMLENPNIPKDQFIKLIPFLNMNILEQEEDGLVASLLLIQILARVAGRVLPWRKMPSFLQPWMFTILIILTR